MVPSPQVCLFLGSVGIHSKEVGNLAARERTETIATRVEEEQLPTWAYVLEAE